MVSRMAQKFFVGELKISSSSFGPDERIPDRYTGEGEDVSPPLEWNGVPNGTQSLAVVVHDPDAPLVDGFTHWVLYGIPSEVTSLAEGTTDFVAGKNSFGNERYNGPAPPRGHGLHRYYFWVYALDSLFDLAPGLDRRSLFGHIEDHVIEQARLVGVFQR